MTPLRAIAAGAAVVATALAAACGGGRARADEWWAVAEPCPGGQLVREPVGAAATNIYCEHGGERAGRRTALLPDGTRGDGRYRDGKRDGAWEVRYPNGRPKVRGTYRDDEIVGEWIRYWSTGTPGIRGAYRHGRRTGAWTFYTVNGAVDRVDYYVDGRPCPPGTQARDADAASDHLRCELPDGTAHGPSVEWYPDGGVKTRGQYDHGREQGEFVSFDPDGAERARVTYIDGSIVSGTSGSNR